MTDLNEKTLFISGASRGIGLAIAKRAAQDGANIVVAAKTDKPHKHLPGTIHSAAEEIEAAGGKAFAVVMDVRNEENVAAAVEQAVAKFGGIDICINNASAINLRPSSQLSMSSFDLMNQINYRGTYLLSKLCAPHLEKSENPHVLTMSPPIRLHPEWYGSFVAYAISKISMSLAMLGMAEEYRDKGIAFNALWPRTTIATAAVEFALGGDEMTKRSRTPDILVDAAYTLLTKPAAENTGRFLIDDSFLFENGVTDFGKYAVNPEYTPYLDILVPEDDEFPAPPGVETQKLSVHGVHQ